MTIMQKIRMMIMFWQLLSEMNSNVIMLPMGIKAKDLTFSFSTPGFLCMVRDELIPVSVSIQSGSTVV